MTIEILRLFHIPRHLPDYIIARFPPSCVIRRSLSSRSLRAEGSPLALILLEDRSASPKLVGLCGSINRSYPAWIFSISLAMCRLRGDLVVLLVIVLAEAQCIMMRIVGENHSKCGCPAASQRQPRSIPPPKVQGLLIKDDASSSSTITATAITTTTGRIFNGKPSRKGAWPWQVSLQLLHPKLGFIGHWCGGVLIDPKWVITAAHCIHNELFNLPIGVLWTAVVGEWELDSGGRGSARLPVEKVILHDRFNNYVHDIALMKLARPAPLSKVVRTICLPGPGQYLGKGQCVASGWGRYGPSPSLSTALLEASVPLLNLKECLQAYGTSVPIRKGHLCAGQTDGSSGSCVGDSGGPLQCRRPDGVWQLVGVTSFGSGCARPGYPDVYTEIQHYLNWINSTIDANNDDDDDHS